MKSLILWLIKRRPEHKYNITSWTNKLFGCKRFEPFWNDEYLTKGGRILYRRPWYLPFTVLLHWWRPAEGYIREEFHDHPRWSITIVLRGRLLEHTPWRIKVLTPGDVVFRSKRCIHAIEILPEDRGKTWTLFIVGRRMKMQNTYVVTRVV